MPTPLRCSRLWAAAGGTARMCRQEKRGMSDSYPDRAASFWNVEGTVRRAPTDPIMTIYRVKHVVTEAIELPPVMPNATRGGFGIVADISSQLHHGELLSGDAPDQLTLIKPTSQDELARIKGIERERLTGVITQKQVLADRR